MTIKHLSDEFLKTYCEKRLRKTTVNGYRVNLEKHILPELGENTLIELVTVKDLDELSEALLNKGLSKRSVIYCHATLRKAFNWAIKRSYIMVNPYNSFDLPRAEDFAYKTLSENEIRKVLELTDGFTPIERAIRLALKYGLRRGEVLGVIPARDLDYDRNILHIKRSRVIINGEELTTPCKTKESNRYILLDNWDSAAIQSAAEKRPEEYYIHLTTYQLNSQFQKFLRENDLPAIRFHDLRHSYATYMLTQGVNPKIVSKVLGHSGVEITLDIYSHPEIEAQKACLEAIERVDSI